MMKNVVARLLTPFAGLSLLPVMASAHPGHDGGHDLTWDFTSIGAHPLPVLGCLLAIVIVGIWTTMQRGVRIRKHLRGSPRSSAQSE